MDTLGAVAGPAAAFLILLFFTGNYRLVFWLSMIPGTIAVFIIILFIKEKKVEREKTSLPKLSLKDFDWRYRAFIAIVTLFAIGNSSDVFLILKATDVGFKETQIPIIYLSFNFVYALTSLPAGILSDRIGRKRVILTGFILFGFIYLGFAVSSEQSHIFGLFLLYGVFMGLTEGVQKAYLGTIIPAEFRATGYGIYNTFVGIAIFPASVIGGYLWDNHGPHATFYYGSITAFTSAILFLIIFSRDIRRKKL